MVQKPISETSSWTVENDQYDIGDEVERACTRLQDAIREKTSAQESMEFLFKQRRDDALNEVKKAQHHLEFVKEEEERLRKILSDENLNSSKVIYRDAGHQHKFFEHSLKDHPRDKAESATQEDHITNTIISLHENRQFVDVDYIMRRIDNNLERLSVRATGPVPKGLWQRNFELLERPKYMY